MKEYFFHGKNENTFYVNMKYFLLPFLEMEMINFKTKSSTIIYLSRLSFFSESNSSLTCSLL